MGNGVKLRRLSLIGIKVLIPSDLRELVPLLKCARVRDPRGARAARTWRRRGFVISGAEMPPGPGGRRHRGRVT